MSNLLDIIETWESIADNLLHSVDNPSNSRELAQEEILSEFISQIKQSKEYKDIIKQAEER